MDNRDTPRFGDARSGPLVYPGDFRRSGAIKIVVIGIDLGNNLCSLTGLDEAGADANRLRVIR